MRFPYVHTLKDVFYFSSTSTPSCVSLSPYKCAIRSVTIVAVVVVIFVTQ